MRKDRKIANNLRTKNDYESFELEYFKENPYKRVSARDIYSLFECVPKLLVEVIERLELKKIIKLEFDENGKKCYIYPR